MMIVFAAPGTQTVGRASLCNDMVNADVEWSIVKEFDRPADGRREPAEVEAVKGLVIGAVAGMILWALVAFIISVLV